MVGLPTSSTAATAVSRSHLAHAEMAMNVFHHDDGVIHQNAYGKNQREESDAVQCVAIEVIEKIS